MLEITIALHGRTSVLLSAEVGYVSAIGIGNGMLPDVFDLVHV